MVAPLAAMMGRGAMSIGADIAGPTAARSQASKTLRTGEGGSFMPDLKELKLIAKGALKHIIKITEVLAKHSPALQQQLVVISKSITLFLRPIGDIMAKFLRPMAIWLIKFASKWYQLFGGGGAESDPADALLAAEKQLAAAKYGGDPDEISAAQAQYDEALANVNKTSETGTGSLGIPNLSASAGIDALLKGLGDAAKAAWDVLGPPLKILWDFLKFLGEGTFVIVLLPFIGALKLLEWLFIGIKVGADYLVKSVDVLGKMFNWLYEKVIIPIGDWISKTFIKIWETLLTTITSVYTWIENTFIKIWDTLLEGIKTFINGLIDLWNSIPILKDVPKLATGGPIRESGLYSLHAGERIMTAGDTQRSKNNRGNTSVNNYITMNASISNEMDIRTIARKLAEYSEVEIRRRVSY